MSTAAGSTIRATVRQHWRSAAWVAACLGAVVACSSPAVTEETPDTSSQGAGGTKAGSSSSTTGGRQEAGGSGGASKGTGGASKGTGGSSNQKAGDGAGGAGVGSASGGSNAGSGGVAGRGKGSGGDAGRAERGGSSVADGGRAGASAGGEGGAAGRGGRSGQGGGAGEAQRDGGKAGSGAAGNGDRADAGGKGGGPGDGGQSAGYKPCPTNGDPCKILPLGDSITVGLKTDSGGANANGGYRVELFTRAVQANQNITFVGTQSPNGPATVAGKPFPTAHEGISGQRIQEIQGRVANAATKTKPHIVLVMAGTNDLYSPLGSGTMLDRLGKLLDAVITDLPDALVVVSTLTPLTMGYKNEIKAYNAAIPGLAQTRAAAGKHIETVDFGTVTEGMLSQDGVHPSDAGYKAMGDIWYEAIRDVLPPTQ